MRDRAAADEGTDEAALHTLIEAMRLEVARELGYSGVEEGQCGHWTNAQSGHFGATLYKRAKAVLTAQQDSTASSDAGARSKAATAGPSGRLETVASTPTPSTASAQTSKRLNSVPENGRNTPAQIAPKIRHVPENRQEEIRHAKS